MLWILVFVIPTTLTIHDPSIMRDGRAFAGANTMTYVQSFKSHNDCANAANRDMTRLKRTTPGSFYMCMNGEVY